MTNFLTKKLDILFFGAYLRKGYTICDVAS
jgi:hypothetical protein